MSAITFKQQIAIRKHIADYIEKNGVSSLRKIGTYVQDRTNILPAPTTIARIIREYGYEIGNLEWVKKMNEKDNGYYLIRNIVTQDVYIGGTKGSIDERWNSHKVNLRRGEHPNKNLQKDWDEYGEASFVFEVLENEYTGMEKETEYIIQYAPNCYNVSPASMTKAKINFKYTRSRKSNEP